MIPLDQWMRISDGAGYFHNTNLLCGVTSLCLIIGMLLVVSHRAGLHITVFDLLAGENLGALINDFLSLELPFCFC